MKWSTLRYSRWRYVPCALICESTLDAKKKKKTGRCKQAVNQLWLHKNVDCICPKETTRKSENQPRNNTEGETPQIIFTGADK